MIAVGERNAGIGTTTGSCRHTGHDLEGHPVLGQRLDFLAATTENERVAPFRRTTRLPSFARRTSRTLISSCGNAWFEASLAGVDLLGVGAGEIEHVFGAQMVVGR